jgi:DNA polymerase-3 subunit gamma/tau
VSHAYLFSGPRGTGKTSSARILAKALNCDAPSDGEPCGVCTSCREITQGTSLNVHELDAASNNGVDAMRDLVAHAGLGTPGRWKVYIVDEVHMLSPAAANALLKTLEEPPSHVVFVLATTDPQKVPPTIRSRTQHLEFRLLGADTLHALLDAVNAEAGLDLGAEEVEAAVRRGRGSARDALSALDQVLAAGSVDAARPELAPVLDAVAGGDVAEVLVALSGLLAGGWGPQQLATELVDDLRQVFLAALAPELCAASGPAREHYVAVAEHMGLPRVVRTLEILGHAMVDMREAPDAQVVLEIGLVRAVRPDLDLGLDALADRVTVLERTLSGGAAAPHPAAPPAPAAPRAPAADDQPSDPGRRPSIGAVRRSKQATAADVTPPAVSVDPPAAEAAELAAVVPPAEPALPRTTAPPAALDRDTLTEAWGDGILHSLPARAKARYASGRFVAVDEQGAHFALPNAAHRDQCAEQQPLVEAALAAHFGTPVKLMLVIDEAAPPPERTNTPATAGSDAAAEAAPRQSGRRRAAPPPEADEVVEDVDPAEFAKEADPEEQASAAEARLMQAFPGASEVLG